MDNTLAEEQVLCCVPDLMIQWEQVSFIYYLWVALYMTHLLSTFLFWTFEVQYLRI